MQYNRIKQAVFLQRLNRFVALVEKDGETVRCHVKNTGRCAELLTCGARVWVQEKPPGDGGKTECTLITVDRGGTLVNVDSGAPNRLFSEWAAAGRLPFFHTEIQPERTWCRSRFDFFLSGRGKGCFCEVKGVTLERNGTALFPDAPTERGLKHVLELCDAVGEGYGGLLLFVIQMKGPCVFCPNDETHPAFGQALRQAQKAGVQIAAVDCVVTPDSIAPGESVPVCLL